MKAIRAALIGYGRMGANLAGHFHRDSRFILDSICDARPEAQEEIKKTGYAGINFTTDPEDIFRDGNIDAVVIATLPESHFPLARRALESGKHVFVEKPIAETAREAEALIRLAKAGNKTLIVDHTLLYEQAAERLILDLKKNMYGDLGRLSFSRVQPYDKRFADRSCFVELGPHVLSVLDLFDEYRSGAAKVQVVDGDMKRAIRARISLESGLEGEFYLEYKDGMPKDSRETELEFRAERLRSPREVMHRLVWDERRPKDDPRQNIIITSNDGTPERIVKVGNKLPLGPVIADFYASIMLEREPKSNGGKALRVTQMMDGLDLSHSRGGVESEISLMQVERGLRLAI